MSTAIAPDKPFTESQLNKLKIFVQVYAKETVTVEQRGSAVYVYGSELACLRIFKKYVEAGNENIKCDYSTNLNTHYFRIETSSPKN